MSLPINIEQLLEGNIVEWERVDFKAGWNPEDVMHTMCAFANDIHNWGGGYIVCGVAEHDGKPVLPPIGLESNQLDSIQKKLVEIAAQVQPTVNYVVEPVVFREKNILVIWIPGGDNRPYKSPTALGKESIKQGRRYYVRKGSVTCIADAEDERRLLALTNKIPFDDRLCHQAQISDLNKFLIADFLQQIGSNITEDDLINMPMEQLCWDMQIIGGTSEYVRPKNVGVLFFSKNPEKFIPGARIEIVRFGKEPSEVFEEKILNGPIHKQLEDALSYLEHQVVTEKVKKQPGKAAALRAYNYPYQALEEIVCNAVYHKSWDDRNPIEINIYPDRITVYNIEGPLPPLTNDDMQKEHVISRNYRNRRIGDLLKELELTEGRNTGFPKVYREIRKNGSPLPKFETDERNMYFMATLPIHQIFLEDDNASVVEPVVEQLTERQRFILKSIGESVVEGVVVTASILAKKMNVSPRTIQRELAALQKMGKLSRQGGDSNGTWVLLK